MPQEFYTRIHDIFRKSLESGQDMIIIGLCLLLFMLMLNVMSGLVASVFKAIDFKFIAAEIIFVLVLIEIYRLLIIYLREHRIAVDIMVEVGIVSTLREVILKGVLDIEPFSLFAISIFLVSLMLLLRYGAIRIEEIEKELKEGIISEIKKLLERG